MHEGVSACLSVSMPWCMCAYHSSVCGDGSPICIPECVLFVSCLHECTLSFCLYTGMSFFFLCVYLFLSVFLAVCTSVFAHVSLYM